MEGGVPRIATGKKNPRPVSSPQLSLFETEADKLRKRLGEVDVMNLTPLEALTVLDELKRMV